MYLIFINLHGDKLAIAGEPRNLTFLRVTDKKCQFNIKESKHGVGVRKSNMYCIVRLFAVKFILQKSHSYKYYTIEI